jgi:hypothetical protein
MSLRPLTTSAASVIPTAGGWRLQIPAGEAGQYRLAQLDDYAALSRSRFPLRTPTTLGLRCRVSEPNLPGTWGFGLWNDPFAFSFGLQGLPRRLPVLPNCCWFFHASEKNHLSFRDSLPGNGFLAQCFRSSQIPSLLLAPGLLGLPLLFSKTLSKWIRAVSGKIIKEDSLALDIDVTQWHTYHLSWRESGVAFSVDEAVVFETPISPRGPLGLVIWIDNQYAAWTPNGRIGYGTLQQKAAGWMEIEQVKVE